MEFISRKLMYGNTFLSIINYTGNDTKMGVVIINNKYFAKYIKI